MRRLAITLSVVASFTLAQGQAIKSTQTTCVRGSGCSSDLPTRNYGHVEIIEVQLKNAPSLSPGAQAELSQTIKDYVHGYALDEVKERVVDAYQQQGFFKVEVGQPQFEIIERVPLNKAVAIVPVISEGAQYTLKQITFQTSPTRTNPTGELTLSPGELRGAFPIADGDVFDTSKIRQGLDELRTLYGERGYINFTPVADTQIDDARRSIGLAIDIDEGKQFRIGRVTGLEKLESLMAQDFRAFGEQHAGKPYNSKLVEYEVLKWVSNGDECIDLHKDEKRAIVDIDLSRLPECGHPASQAPY
jgi:outer membrane protein assembly factor BamA